MARGEALGAPLNGIDEPITGRRGDDRVPSETLGGSWVKVANHGNQTAFLCFLHRGLRPEAHESALLVEALCRWIHVGLVPAAAPPVWNSSVLGKALDMNLRPLRRNAAGSEVEQVISRLEYEAAEIKHRRVTDDQWSFYYSQGYADAIEEMAKLLRERLRTLH